MLEIWELIAVRKQHKIGKDGGDFLRKPRPDKCCSATDDDELQRTMGPLAAQFHRGIASTHKGTENNEDNHNVYFSSNITPIDLRVMKPRRIRWTRNATRMRTMRNAYKV
jgi:hypothetical protein